MNRRAAKWLLPGMLAGTFVSCREQAVTRPPTAPQQDNDLTSPAVGTRADIADTSVVDKYIIVLQDGPTDPLARAQAITKTYQGRLRFVFRSALRGFSGRFSPAAIALIERLPDVKYVEPLRTVKTASSGSASAPYFNLDIIDQPTLSRDYTYSWDQDGSGVTAYVIDSGVNTSLTEFGGRAQTDADLSDGSGGWGADCANHGTSVAALLGGSTYGVARNVQIRSVRVLPCSGTAPDDWAIAGMDWVSLYGVRPAVVNMSFRSSRTTAMNDAVQRLETNGFRTVAAAGNDNAPAANYSPASASTTFTVGNAYYDGSSLTRNPDSNYGGPYVGIWAPGQNAVTVDNTGAPRAFGGTSGAAPHVAGWVAIYLSSDPAIPSHTLYRYATATSKMTVTAMPGGGYGNFLYTRLQFVSLINEESASVPAGSTFTFTSSQYQGVGPYTFTWRQAGNIVCTGTSSCTVASPGTPGYGDTITLTTQDGAGHVWVDSNYLMATCPDGGYSC